MNTIRPYTNEEFNILCAKFLGWYYENFVWKSIISHNGGFMAISKTDKLEFHSDWNLIMEVVENIEELKINTSLTNKYFNIMSVNNQTGITLGSSKNATTKKEAVIQAIWQFLNVYNK
jgi:hypothetical protein